MGDTLSNQPNLSNRFAETGFLESYTGELTPELATPEMLAGLGVLMHQLNPDEKPDEGPVTMAQLEPYFGSDSQAILVDVQEHQLIGTISGARYSSLISDDVFSGSLIVEKDHRGGNSIVRDMTSYGRLLYQLEDLGAAYGAASLNCTIDPDNTDSKTSHDSRGYHATSDQFWEKKLDADQARVDVPYLNQAETLEEYPDDYIGPAWGMTAKLQAGMAKLLGDAYDETRLQKLLNDRSVMVAVKFMNGNLACAVPVTIGGELFAGQYAFQGPMIIDQAEQPRQSDEDSQATRSSMQKLVDGFALAKGATSVFHLVNANDMASQELLKQAAFKKTTALYYTKAVPDHNAS